jgi:hypothetical protein
MIDGQNLEKKFMQTTELENGNFSFKIWLPQEQIDQGNPTTAETNELKAEAQPKRGQTSHESTH